MIIIIQLILRSFAVIFAITIHEFTKAKISTKLCDPLPQNNGRLTLNPLSHFDAIGFLSHLLTGCGWGKPVPTSALHYKDKKNGTIITYTVPSLINLLIGIAFGFLFVSMRHVGTSTFYFYTLMLIRSLAVTNVSLAVVNIVPIHPLDGARVLSACMTPNNVVKFSSNQQLFQILLIILILLGIIPAFVSMITSTILPF
jgi:Zn-dependent protease